MKVVETSLMMVPVEVGYIVRTPREGKQICNCCGATTSEGVGMRAQGKQRKHENYKVGRARE